MTTRDDLVHLVDDCPDSPMAQAMLYDWLIGEEDRTHTEATEIIEHVASIARERLRLAHATRTYAIDQLGAAFVDRTLRSMFAMPEDATFIVLIGPGEGVPTRYYGWDEYRSRYFAQAVIIAPGQWVLDMIALYHAARLRAV